MCGISTVFLGKCLWIIEMGLCEKWCQYCRCIEWSALVTNELLSVMIMWRWLQCSTDGKSAVARHLTRLRLPTGWVGSAWRSFPAAAASTCSAATQRRQRRSVLWASVGTHQTSHTSYQWPSTPTTTEGLITWQPNCWPSFDNNRVVQKFSSTKAIWNFNLGRKYASVVNDCLVTLNKHSRFLFKQPLFWSCCMLEGYQ